MKKNPASKIISALVFLFSAIALFVMFAPAFAEDVATSYGNVYQVMFGNIYKNNQVVPLLVVAFSLNCLGCLLSIGGFILNGKSAKGLFALETLLFAGAGVLFLFTQKFYEAANNTQIALAGGTGLGGGTISAVVFLFLSAVVSASYFFFVKDEQ
jgi:hypothetical protein